PRAGQHRPAGRRRPPHRPPGRRAADSALRRRRGAALPARRRPPRPAPRAGAGPGMLPAVVGAAPVRGGLGGEESASKRLHSSAFTFRVRQQPAKAKRKRRGARTTPVGGENRMSILSRLAAWRPFRAAAERLRRKLLLALTLMALAPVLFLGV